MANELRIRIRKELYETQRIMATVCRISPSTTLPQISTLENKVICQSGEVYREYFFDDIIAAHSTQDECLNVFHLPLTNFNNGYHQCLIAMGSSGSGKSHTILGSNGEEGLLAYVLRNSLQIITSPCNMVVSVTEITSKGINDLLDNFGNTRLSEKIKQNTYRIRNSRSIEKLIEFIMNTRVTARTDANKNSSRSHLVITIAKLIGNQPSYFTITDCAGFEPKQATESHESNFIDSSLSALSKTLRALATQNGHIPYRDSRLTMQLKPYLNKNTKINVMAAVGADLPSSRGDLLTLDTVSSLTGKQRNIQK